MNETIQLINNRKSLRAYADRPIDRKTADLIINGAMRAPTAGNMMLYTILEVTRKADKEKLVKTCDNQPFIAKAPLVLIFLADMQRWQDYYVHSGVPELCKQREQEYAGLEESDLMLACCDALIAAQNAVVTAESLGIGSCYIGDIMENIESHRAMFNLPRYVFPVTMLCFGYFKESYLTQKPRTRFQQKFIHFQDTYKQLNHDEFEEMYADPEKNSKGSYLKPATNYGQHMYLRKTGADFSREMRRSVKVAIRDWLGE